MSRALVYGLAVAGEASVRALQRHDIEVIVADDTATPDRVNAAQRLGVHLVERPDDATLASLLANCDLVCPSPGVPESHAVFGLARAKGVEIVSEIELAYRWEQERPGGPRPMLAVTGTDGKTTTTLMAVGMLRAAGLDTIDAGNTETPLVDAIEQDFDAFVVECTSFRLAGTHHFRADAAAWLNLAPDHLNWHHSMATYENAKAQIFTHQHRDDVSIGFADDEVVMRHLSDSAARQRSFGLDHGDYRLTGGTLYGPDGAIADVESMSRRLPHDITNALAASALVLETGLAQAEHIERALSAFTGPPHRLESIGQWGGIEWFNDSKATTPHATGVAIKGFERVVLIAGGYDKGVDLAPMTRDAERVRAVIALGETAPSIAELFSEAQLFSEAPSVDMADDLPAAVRLAAGRAAPGDVVLLSPGCASFDQYTGFEARGEHFRTLVRELHEEGSR